MALFIPKEVLTKTAGRRLEREADVFPSMKNHTHIGNC
jgi:hypothetical protein